MSDEGTKRSQPKDWKIMHEKARLETGDPVAERIKPVIRRALGSAGGDALAEVVSTAVSEELRRREAFDHIDAYPPQTRVGQRVRTYRKAKKQGDAAFLDGVVVRSDNAQPGLTVIRLDDGRHVLATECGYQFIAPWTQEELIVRPVLFWFVSEMEKKLKVNDREKGRLGWRQDSCTLAGLYDMMLAELEELRGALFVDRGPDASPINAIEECADAANFLMMMADKIRLATEAGAMLAEETGDAGSA